MNNDTRNAITFVSRWTRFLGAMLIIALMVSGVAFSQPAPVLVAPAANATGQPQAPTLIWDAVSGGGPITYHLQYAKDAGFSIGLQDFPGLTATSQLITGLAVNTDYYWHVLTLDNGTPGSYSIASKFTTWVSIPTPGPLPVDLLSTARFAVLAYSAITSTGTYSVIGDVGVSPLAGSFLGLAQSNVSGTMYAVDATGPAGTVVAPALLTVAMGDLTTAYNDAAGRTVNPIGLAGNLGGQTLYPGLYKSTSFLEISAGDLTLDANGDANSVWIFQIASSFNMTPGRKVFLTNQAKASNVYWQVGTAATFNTTTVMKGTIMAGTQVTMATGATLEGRALAMTANVTLDANAVTNPSGTVPVYLGTAGTFTVLAGNGVSGTGNVTGDIGTSTGTIAAGITASGTKILGGGAVTTAHNELNAAYTNAAGRTPTATIAPALAGTMNPGVYNSTDGTFGIAGTLTLDAIGDPNAVWIFQTTSTLTTSVSSVVALAHSAKRSNIFWQVGSNADLGASSTFEGNILANSSITANSATVDGKLLAGAVDANGTVALTSTVALPVELAAFTATTNGLNAELRWTTATELNNYGFEIQRRSVASGSVDQWQKAGFVPGAGTSATPRQYSYTDRGLTQGRYDYRIKQIDKSGSFKYSSASQVEVGSAPKQFALSQSYPNPFNPSTMVEFSVAQSDRAVVKVFNVLGQEVATIFDGTAEAGKMYQARFDASRMSSGMYYVRLQSNGQAKMQKMVFLK